jgi:hypothetical protein
MSCTADLSVSPTIDLVRPLQFGLTTHHDLGEQDVAFVLTLADGSDTSGIYNSMAQRLTAFVESAVCGQEIEIDNRA